MEDVAIVGISSDTCDSKEKIIGIIFCEPSYIFVRFLPAKVPQNNREIVKATSVSIS